MNAPLRQTAQPRPAIIRSGDYDKMIRAGALDRFARVELRDGVIYEMNPQHSDHGYIKGDLAFALRDALRGIGSQLRVGTEITLRGDDLNAPAPDISVCERFAPGPIPIEAVRLLVEVADTSLDYDLGLKRSLYARLGVPEYWVADVKGRILRQFAHPSEGAYGTERTILLGEAAAALTIDGLIVPTDGLV